MDRPIVMPSLPDDDDEPMEVSAAELEIVRAHSIIDEWWRHNRDWLASPEGRARK